MGLSAAESLAKKGNYFVVMACRDVEKGKRGEFVWRVVDRRQRYDAFDMRLTSIYSLLVSLWYLFVSSFHYSCQGEGISRRIVHCHEARIG